MLTIYSAEGSNSGLRVEWALQYKGIDYQRVEVTREDLAQRYHSINPMQLVPFVQHDGVVVSESMAIIEYLEECCPKPGLLGHRKEERVLIRQICEYVNGTIHSPQNRTILDYWRPGLSSQQKRELRGRWIVSGLSKIECMLFRESGYAIGHEFSLADIFVAAMYMKAQTHGADSLARYGHHLALLNKNGRTAPPAL